MTATRCHIRRPGFTLIELLVVIGIIAILMAIMLPVLSAARKAALGAKSMSNLRQMGIGVQFYLNDHRDTYFNHECYCNILTSQFYPDQTTDANATHWAKAHWEDIVATYLPAPSVCLSPLLTGDERSSGTWMNYFAVSPYSQYLADGVTPNPQAKQRGGYGYNHQFLGWEVNPPGNPAKPNFGFNAKLGVDVTVPSMTVLIGDTAGTHKGNLANAPSNSYAVEPPLPSLNLGAKVDNFYCDKNNSTHFSTTPGGTDSPNPGPYDWARRCTPSPRNNGSPGFVFCDGHGAQMSIETIDDSNNDGQRDDGYWSGKGSSDPNVR